MTATSPLILYDRSRVTTDWTCQRKRWWQYEYDGTGIVAGHTSLELFMGTTLHDGLAAIAQMEISGSVDIDLIALTARQQMLDCLLAATTGEVGQVDFAMEQATLVEGLLRGFYIHAWPKLRETYPTILHVEKEMTFEHDGLTFMSRPDLVVADKEGNIYYIEYKSTSSKKEGWVNSWQTAVQLHSSVKAIEATTGEKVTGVIVQGLYKGYESYGKQNSPFCYAYRRQGTPPFSQDEIRYDYKAGFKRFPTWELPGGVAQWIGGMASEVLGDQFPQVPPIFVNEDLVRSFFSQRAVREQEIKLANGMMQDNDDEEAVKMILDTTYQQKFDQCHPYFGRACSYLRLCHGGVIDPYLDGYIKRQPHHDLEVEQDKETA